MAMIKVTTLSWMSLLKNPRAMEWGKTVHVPKKGWHYFICLWVLFHCWCWLIYGSTAASKMSRVESSCWFGWKITLKEKNWSFQLLPLTCCGHHLWHGGGAGVGHQDAEWSGSASLGSDFLWHLLKPTENCPKNQVFCPLALKWTL